VIKAALKVGDQRLYKTIRGFGFGRATGIDLPGESSGILHPVEGWRPITKAYVSFGQGVSVTPLQLTTALSAVANGGTLLKPHVVAAVGGGGVVRPVHAAPPVVGKPVTPATAQELARLLEGVVVAGTGRGAGVAGYRVAGKTGTAQIPVAGGYARNSYLPSFVGFAPAGRPVMVGLVAVAEPKGFLYHGGQVAAPVFGAVARQVLLYMGVRPEREPLAVWPGQILRADLGAVSPAPVPAPLPAEDDGFGEDILGGPEGVHVLTDGEPVTDNLPAVEGR
jgi:stage V sporulation protein D (sporulation-specific penicillin-binding protein)